MKSFYVVLSLFVVFISCKDTDQRDVSLLPESVGNINTLQIITPNSFWNGAVGEEIRKYFAAPVDGLPQEEPLYNMSQMPPETFSDFARKYRLFLQATIGDEEKFTIEKNPFATPQVGAFIESKSIEGLIQLIETNHKEILAAFHEAEIKEDQKRINISPLKLDSLKNHLGVSLRVPSAYHIAKATDSFYWLRKDLESGTTNIMVYEVPITMIGKDSSVVGDIIKIRDSVGSKLLPVEDEDLFVTEDAYAPFLNVTTIDGQPAYETKGTWEVKNAYMGGPFINYAVKDEKNNRYLILEGFTHAPSVSKRDLQFELEAILNSAKIE